MKKYRQKDTPGYGNLLAKRKKQRAESRRAKIGERDCLVCGKSVPYRHVKAYCSQACRQRAYMGLTVDSQSMVQRWGVSPAAVGAAHEMLACADLIKHGFDVFRCVAPNASCDVAILDGHTLYRVEVKTGYRARTGKLYHTPTRHKDFDILAVVEESGAVNYVASRDTMSLPLNLSRIEEKRRLEIA